MRYLYKSLLSMLLLLLMALSAGCSGRRYACLAGTGG
ncbi:hypothetical protein SCACP_23140 [Sporomusa carbonis]